MHETTGRNVQPGDRCAGCVRQQMPHAQLPWLDGTTNSGHAGEGHSEHQVVQSNYVYMYM